VSSRKSQANFLKYTLMELSFAVIRSLRDRITGARVEHPLVICPTAPDNKREERTTITENTIFNDGSHSPAPPLGNTRNYMKLINKMDIINYYYDFIVQSSLSTLVFPKKDGNIDKKELQDVNYFLLKYHLIAYPILCIKIAAAAETLSESNACCISILTIWLNYAVTLWESPLPSLPMTSTRFEAKVISCTFSPSIDAP